MNILLTGSSGFIASNLLQHLSSHNVIQLDIKEQGVPLQNLLIEDLGPIDVIFHLAATPRVGVSLLDPANVLKNNVDSTTHLLEYCRYHPSTKLIFISSSSVKFAKLSRNPYALSKAMGEQLVNLYRDTYKVHATSVRLFNVYGPGEADYGKFTTLLKQCKKGLLSGEGFYIEGDGDIIRDYTHIQDVCEGLIKVMKHMIDNPDWNLYELGSGDASVTVNEIVEEFQKGTNLPIEYRPRRVGDPSYTCANRYLRPTWEPKIKVLDYICQWKDSGCPHD